MCESAKGKFVAGRTRAGFKRRRLRIGGSLGTGLGVGVFWFLALLRFAARGDNGDVRTATLALLAAIGGSAFVLIAGIDHRLPQRIRVAASIIGLITFVAVVVVGGALVLG